MPVTDAHGPRSTIKTFWCPTNSQKCLIYTDTKQQFSNWNQYFDMTDILFFLINQSWSKKVSDFDKNISERYLIDVKVSWQVSTK